MHDDLRRRPPCPRIPRSTAACSSLIGDTPLVEIRRLGRESRARRCARQGRAHESRRLGEGPHLPGDDRGRRATGPPRARRRGRRADQRQHRHRPRAGRAPPRLPLRPDDAREHEPRAPSAAAGLRRRGRADARGRADGGRDRQGTRDRRGARPAPSCRSSSTTRRIPEVHYDTTAVGDPPRARRAAARRVRRRRRHRRHDQRRRRALARAPPELPRSSRVEPESCATISRGERGPTKIQGIAAGFVPKNYDSSVPHEVRTVSDERAYHTKQELARREGLLVGISAGANVAIALDVARELGPGKNVVTVLCDTGERYFSLDEYFADGSAEVGKVSDLFGDRAALREKARWSSASAGSAALPRWPCARRRRAPRARRRRRGRRDEPAPPDPVSRTGRRRRQARRCAQACSAGAASPDSRSSSCARAFCPTTRATLVRRSTSWSKAPTTSRPSSWPPTPVPLEAAPDRARRGGALARDGACGRSPRERPATAACSRTCPRARQRRTAPRPA